MKCPAPAAPPAPPVPRCRAAASHTRNRSDLFVAARLNPYPNASFNRATGAVP
jgi:hypothetical protein